MSDTAEIPALRRLRDLGALDPTPERLAARGRFRYQPGLDGLRALAVIAVILYHAGFSWMRGGWVGVEVFFVVSGFLITALLLDEHDRTGTVALGQFWLRRARRLLPALIVMLAAVAGVALAVGSAGQLGQLRRDLPWALGYLGNWGQIVGDIPYYTGDPPLLRHLWSLAIEEQFYLVWPLVFLALVRSRLTRVATAGVVAAGAVAAMALMAWLQLSGPGPVDLFGGVDRVNFMYLSTFTRAGGLLLGAAAAFVWRPWRLAPPIPGRRLDSAGGVGLGGLLCIAGAASLTAGYVYLWLLPLVSVLSLVAVLVVVHPAARGMRRLLGTSALVEVGKRSYGLYLWHWPIFVLLGATHGAVGRFVVALGLTVVVAELSYRYVETPVRNGDFVRWWRHAGEARARPVLAAAATVVVLAGCYVAVDPYDRAAGGDAATFEAPVVAPVAVPQRRPRRRRRRHGGSSSSAIRRPTRWPSTCPTGSRARSPSGTARSTGAACTTADACAAAGPASTTPSGCAAAGSRTGPRRPDRSTPRWPSSCSARGTCSTWRPPTERG